MLCYYATFPISAKGAFKLLQILHAHTSCLLYLTRVEVENKTMKQPYNLEGFI